MGARRSSRHITNASLGTERLSSQETPMQNYDTKKMQFLIPLKMAGKHLEIVTSVTDHGEGGSDAARDDAVAIHTHAAKSPFYSARRRNAVSPTLSFGSGAPPTARDKPTSPTVREMRIKDGLEPTSAVTNVATEFRRDFRTPDRHASRFSAGRSPSIIEEERTQEITTSPVRLSPNAIYMKAPSNYDQSKIKRGLVLRSPEKPALTKASLFQVRNDILPHGNVTAFPPVMKKP